MAKIKTFDLSAIGLVPGTYNVSVIGRSDESEDVIESDTLVYKIPDPLEGTWVFKNRFTTVTSSNNVAINSFMYHVYMDFTSNGVQYTRFLAKDEYNHSTDKYDSFGRVEYINNGTSTTVWSNTSGGWTAGYETITITRAPYKYYNGVDATYDIKYEDVYYNAFKSWLMANAVKQ